MAAWLCLRFALVCLLHGQRVAGAKVPLSPYDTLQAVSSGQQVEVYVMTSNCNDTLSQNNPLFRLQGEMPFVQLIADDFWWLRYHSEIAVSGLPFKLNTTVSRLLEVNLSNNGSTAVTETFLHPLTGYILSTKTVSCMAGIKPDSAVQFFLVSGEGTSLETYDSIVGAVTERHQLSFAVDLHWCPPYLPEIVQPRWSAAITDFHFEKGGDLIFADRFSWEDYIEYLEFRINTAGNVTVTSFATMRNTLESTQPFIKYCFLGQSETFLVLER